MRTLAVASLFIAAPALASATTCAEYVAMMRAEGVQTLVTTGCINQADVPALHPNWNYIIETPAGACLTSKAIKGDRDAMALMAYLSMMNQQKDAMGCPPTEHPTQHAQQP